MIAWTRVGAVKTGKRQLCKVGHACNPRTQQAEAGGLRDSKKKTKTSGWSLTKLKVELAGFCVDM